MLEYPRMADTQHTENDFWHKLPRPIMVLAPMADVTDEAFRAIIAKYSRHKRKDGSMGGPDVFWTEFVSADGLCSPGRDVLLRDLRFSEAERPIVAQFFTSTPDHMEKVARMASDLGFDGIDINMGCPDKSIEKQGAGAAMMTTPDLAVEVIRAAKRGAGGIPVTVKTRVGWNTVELETWLPKLLSAEPSVITVHARTRKELSLVPARWEHVARAVEIRNALGSETLILGNGDVENLAQAYERVRETGADGVMIGRGIFGNPWLFDPSVSRETIPLPERLRVMVEHTKLFEDKLGDIKSFSIMKKHYKAYVNGFDGAKELRMELMDQPDSKAIEQVIERWIASHKEKTS
jgi:nifR3 family TIM-barrel protein